MHPHRRQPQGYRVMLLFDAVAYAICSFWEKYGRYFLLAKRLPLPVCGTRVKNAIILSLQPKLCYLNKIELPTLEFWDLVKKYSASWKFLALLGCGGEGGLHCRFCFLCHDIQQVRKARAWMPDDSHSLRERPTFGGGEKSQTANGGLRPMAVNAENWPVDRMRHTCPDLDHSRWRWNLAGFSVGMDRLRRFLGVSPCTWYDPIFPRCIYSIVIMQYP